MTCAGCVRAPLAQAIHFLREVALFAAFGIVQLHYYLGSKKPFRKVPGPFHQLPFIAYYPSIMKKRVAYQGIKGSFSSMAASAMLGADFEALTTSRFRDIFEHVTSANADIGIIPIENALAGSVHKNYELLAEFNCPIIAEYYCPVQLHLMAT